MKNYKTIWGIAVGLMAWMFFGLLIYAGLTSDKTHTIIETIDNLDTTKISHISIAPSNADWKINLTIDTLVISDKTIINKIIMSLKSLTEKPAPRGVKRFWESDVTLIFEKSFTADFKDKTKMVLYIYSTQEGLFVQLRNTMGVQTYSCEQLKPFLERMANYKEPVGGDK